MRHDAAMSERSAARVFGVPIEGVNLAIALDRVSTAAQTWIVTVNPEMLLEARRSAVSAQALKQADLRLVDGFGLWGMLRLVGVKTTRVTGMDLAEALVRLAAERGWKMGLIGGGPGQAEAAKRKWQAVFPALPIHAEEGGRVQPDGAVDEAGEEAKLRLTLFAPEVLLVAFGHPKQETWIRQALHEFPSVRVAVGVGGTLDVWGGSLRRAPMLMRRLGLEWMWRLWQEPHRLGRIWRAVVVFPLMFVFDWWKPKT
jgi:N-acetylglucosaminyldiphosphoundecaprenol N-acetyl-beta-D-mannosaminyltransferase